MKHCSVCRPLQFTVLPMESASGSTFFGGSNCCEASVVSASGLGLDTDGSKKERIKFRVGHSEVLASLEGCSGERGLALGCGKTEGGTADNSTSRAAAFAGRGGRAGFKAPSTVARGKVFTERSQQIPCCTTSLLEW